MPFFVCVCVFLFSFNHSILYCFFCTYDLVQLWFNALHPTAKYENIFLNLLFKLYRKLRMVFHSLQKKKKKWRTICIDNSIATTAVCWLQRDINLPFFSGFFFSFFGFKHFSINKFCSCDEVLSSLGASFISNAFHRWDEMIFYFSRSIHTIYC